MSADLDRTHAGWTGAVFEGPRPGPSSAGAVVGVLPGEGVGPEVVGAALTVLSAVEASCAASPRLSVRTGGPIGRDAELLSGRALTDEVVGFCEETFAAGGAVLCGPGGSRFVYDVRRRFDLFCKISPLRPLEALRGSGRLWAEAVAGADVLIVRENCGGVYQGDWRETSRPDGRVAEHSGAGERRRTPGTRGGRSRRAPPDRPRPRPRRATRRRREGPARCARRPDRPRGIRRAPPSRPEHGRAGGARRRAAGGSRGEVSHVVCARNLWPSHTYPD
jgi:hypothetical protein